MSEKLSANLEKLLMEAQSRNASDLHLVCGEPPIFRIDGRLERSEAEPLTAEDVTEFASSIASGDELGRIGHEIGEVSRSIMVGESAARICVSRSSGDLTLAVRLLPTVVPDLNRLSAPKGLIDAASSPSGLIVLSGRTGSGKSTTAYSLLDHINQNLSKNIFTVEDPVMYRLTPKKSIVQQREVGSDIPSDVAGLKLMMRSDADVAFVGEIRTLEVLQACITAAETGHLVITLMHSDTPEAAIERMSEVFSEDIRDVIRKQLSAILRCVCCQRLLPKADGKGRVAAYAVLVPDQEMREAIVEGRDLLSRRTPLPETCLSMPAEIQRLAAEGIIGEQVAKTYLTDM